MLRVMSFQELEVTNTGGLLKITSLCSSNLQLLEQILDVSLSIRTLTVEQIVERQANAIYTRKRATSELRKRLKF